MASVRTSKTEALPSAVADYVGEVFDYYQAQRRPIEAELIQWLKAYKGHDDVYQQYRRLYGDYGWRSTIYFPIIYANIETLTPKIVMAVAGDPDFVGLMPTEVNDVQYVEPMRTIVYKQWDDMKAFDQVIGHVKNQLTYGFAWSKYGWLYEDGIRPVNVPRLNLLGRRIGSKKVDRQVVIHNRPAIKSLPVERIYWDPASGDFDDCMVIIDRYITTRAFLESMANQNKWEGVGNVKYSESVGLQEELEATRKQLHGELADATHRSGVDNPFHKKVEVLEAYGYSKDGKPKFMTVLANRKTILFNDASPHPNGRPPLIYTKNSHFTGQMRGSSEAEYALPMNSMINMLRNYHIDNVNLSVNGMWKVSTFADVDLNQLVSRPWGVVETSDMDGIQPLEVPKPGPDALIEARQLENDIQVTSGVVDFLKGVPAAGFADTATGIERLVAGANSRFAARIVSTQANLVTELVRQMIHMSMSNLGDETAVRIAGASGLKFIKMRMDNIQGDFDIQVKNANEIVSKAVRSQQKLVLYNLFRGDPEINQRELKRTLIMDLIPMAEGKLLMPDTEDLDPDEENLVMSQGGAVIPFPNDDHRDHIRRHSKFLQERGNEMDEQTSNIFVQHIKAHSEIALSVYDPLQNQLGSQPTSGNNLAPGGQNTLQTGGVSGANSGGAAGSISQLLSATGGQNAPQRPA